MKKLYTVLGLFLISGLTQAQTMYDTITLNATIDNTIYQTASADSSNGSGDYLFAGLTDNSRIRRALIQFDIAGAIPAGATVNTATVSLYCDKSGSASTVQMILRKVTTEWGEGESNAPGEEGQGAASETGDASWYHSIYPGSTWSMPGGDFEFTNSAIANIAGSGNTYNWTSSPQLVADVQDMLDDDATNFGWIVMDLMESTPGSSRRFISKDNTTQSAFGPKIIIAYEYEHDPVGIETNSLESLKLFPNPTQNSINLTSMNGDVESVTVFDLSGRMVTQQNTSGQTQVEINVEDWNNGVYLMRVNNGDESKVMKFVVQH